MSAARDALEAMLSEKDFIVREGKRRSPADAMRMALDMVEQGRESGLLIFHTTKADLPELKARQKAELALNVGGH